MRGSYFEGQDFLGFVEFTPSVSFDKGWSIRHLQSTDMAKQGRIQVWLWGGGEFQSVELVYILGKNKI